MLENNIYNIDKEFDYPTIKGIVVKSLEKIAKEEVLKNRANIPEDVIIDSKDDDHHVNVSIYNTLAIPTDFSVQESLI
jgi:hypothetical protein